MKFDCGATRKDKSIENNSSENSLFLPKNTKSLLTTIMFYF